MFMLRKVLSFEVIVTSTGRLLPPILPDFFSKTIRYLPGGSSLLKDPSNDGFNCDILFWPSGVYTLRCTIIKSQLLCQKQAALLCIFQCLLYLSLIHISEPTRPY